MTPPRAVPRNPNCMCGLCRSRRGEPALDLHEADRLLRAKRIGRTHPKQRVAKQEPR